MNKLIISYAGNTQEIAELKIQINNALEKYNHVYVKLGQPGLTYKVKDKYLIICDFIDEFDSTRCTFFANCVPLLKNVSNFHYINDMFFEGWQLYNNNSQCRNLLDQCVDYSQKTSNLRFDLLLGEWSGTKDLIQTMIQDHPVKETTFFTYYGKDVSKGSWSDAVMKPEEHTAETFIAGSQIRCSDLIDPAIYNQTFFSAMVETNLHSEFAMFSEKEAKPIIARRPFIIFGSPGHLKGFRKLGFKSFSPIINESYDDEIDTKKRFSMVLDAMYELTKKDPLKVHEQLKNILEYNKHHFETHQWNKEFKIAQSLCQ